MTIRECFRFNYQKFGYKFFYYGLTAQLLRSYVQNIFTLPLYDGLEVYC